MKIKRYQIDNRSITIIDESNIKPKLKKLVRDTILLACKKQKAAKNFPFITFVFIDHPKDTRLKKAFASEGVSATVNIDEILAGKTIIYLNALVFEMAPRVDAIKSIYGSIVHELIHLWHFNTSDVLKKQETINKRISMILRKKIEENLNKFSLENRRSLKRFAKLREMFLVFFQDIFIEGLARYCEEAAKGNMPFEEKTFEKLYTEAESMAKEFVHKQEEYFTRLLGEIEEVVPDKKALKKFFNLLFEILEITISFGLKQCIYKVGGHMVYTILYINHEINLNKLSKFGYHQFIREYESCIKQKGLKPAITLTSGEGHIDYKRLLKHWLDFFNEFNKHWKKTD